MPTSAPSPSAAAMNAAWGAGARARSAAASATGTAAVRSQRGRQPARQVHLVGVARAQVVEDARDPVEEQPRPGDRPSAAPSADAARRRRRPREHAPRAAAPPPRRGRRSSRAPSAVAHPDRVVEVKLERAARPASAPARAGRPMSARPRSYESQPTADGDAGRRRRARRPPRPRAPPPRPARRAPRSAGESPRTTSHGRGADQIARDARPRRRPAPTARTRPARAAARRAASSGGKRGGGDRDHVVARDCLSAADRKCRMYCAPEIQRHDRRHVQQPSARPCGSRPSMPTPSAG